MTDDNEHIYFKEWRKHAKLSQEALSNIMGYSRSSVAAAETRHYNITLAFIEAFKTAVKAPNIAALFSPPDQVDIEQATLLNYFAHVPKDQRQLVIDVAKGFADRKQSTYDPS